MDAFLEEFTQQIITEAEIEVNTENNRVVAAEQNIMIDSVKISKQVTDRNLQQGNTGKVMAKTPQEKNKADDLSKPDALGNHIKKKKRRAPPPPTNVSPSMLKRKPDHETANIPTKAVIHITVAAKPPQRDVQIGEYLKEKHDPRLSASDVSIGSHGVDESLSDLSIDNPFHPLYEQHMVQLQRQASLASIIVSDSCSELSLSNSFNPRYEEVTRDMNAMKSSMSVAHQTAIDIGKDGLDECNSPSVKKGKGIFKRIKKMFSFMIPCIRKRNTY